MLMYWMVCWPLLSTVWGNRRPLTVFSSCSSCSSSLLLLLLLLSTSIHLSEIVWLGSTTLQSISSFVVSQEAWVPRRWRWAMKLAEMMRTTEATRAVTRMGVELAWARRDPHRVSGAPDLIVASASKTLSMCQGSEMRVDCLKIK